MINKNGVTNFCDYLSYKHHFTSFEDINSTHFIVGSTSQYAYYDYQEGITMFSACNLVWSVTIGASTPMTNDTYKSYSRIKLVSDFYFI